MRGKNPILRRRRDQATVGVWLLVVVASSPGQWLFEWGPAEAAQERVGALLGAKEEGLPPARGSRTLSPPTLVRSLGAAPGRPSALRSLRRRSMCQSRADDSLAAPQCLPKRSHASGCRSRPSRRRREAYSEWVSFRTRMRFAPRSGPRTDTPRARSIRAKERRDQRSQARRPKWLPLPGD